MMPRTKQVGLFAIPASQVSDIQERCKRADHALDASHDDARVLRNDMYRRAFEVSVYKETISSGRETIYGYIAVTQVVGKALHLDENQTVFTPDEVHAMARDVLVWEQSARSEDAVITRMHRTDRKVPLDLIRDVYRAFKQVLTVAAKNNAGVAMATLYEGAEQRLAERRAQRERERIAIESQTHADDEPPYLRDDPNQPPSDNPYPFLSDQWLDYRESQNLLHDPPIHHPHPDALRSSPAVLYVVPERYAPSLHKMLRQAHRLHDYLDTIKQRYIIQQRVQARATDAIYLRRYGEVASITAILCFAITHGAAKRDDGDFTLKQARRFALALNQPLAQRGLQAVIDELMQPFTEGRTRDSTTSAWRAFVRAFDTAAANRCAVFWFW